MTRARRRTERREGRCRPSHATRRLHWVLQIRAMSDEELAALAEYSRRNGCGDQRALLARIRAGTARLKGAKGSFVTI